MGESIPPFPETVYVTQIEDDPGEWFLSACEDPMELADKDESILAAEYKLVRAGRITCEASFTAEGS